MQATRSSRCGTLAASVSGFAREDRPRARDEIVARHCPERSSSSSSVAASAPPRATSSTSSNRLQNLLHLACGASAVGGESRARSRNPAFAEFLAPAL